MTKENCKCGKMAVWLYMPGFSSGSSPYFCDDCVHRGCECNNNYVDEEYPNLPAEGMLVKWIEEGKVWISLDDHGREWPCVEYDYSEEGYEKDEEQDNGIGVLL